MILGRRLQALREAAGLSYEQAGQKIDISPWTIRRMENASVKLKLANVQVLLGHYGVTDPDEVQAFLALVREANQPGWWHRYTDVLPAWFKVYVGLEEAATLIRAYEPQSVPGLLQTPDYARALTHAGFPDAPANELDRRVELRLARQALLTRLDPPHLWVVLDETVLRRPVGGPAVMAAQLDRLAEAATLPHVTIQIMPFAAGAHPAMYGPFHLFRLPAELPDIVYVETMTAAHYLDKPDDITPYRHALDHLATHAAPPEATPGLLHDLAKEFHL
ncbi:helix-turn-helix domain-containing protein [Candidatus Protofrankia californiensis]|uniref:helix-turn-helix domain-containing protein n=1 Tax=Candidatus Protofrankia californiensis TaxID=1839754 RepID=UPI0010412A8A